MPPVIETVNSVGPSKPTDHVDVAVRMEPGGMGHDERRAVTSEVVHGQLDAVGGVDLDRAQSLDPHVIRL